MFAIMRQSGKLYAVKTVDSLDDLAYDNTELERTQTYINEGTPVVFCEDLEDLEDLETLFIKPEDIEVIELE